MTETVATCSCSSFPRKREPRAPGPRRSPWAPLSRGAAEKDHVAQHRDREQSRRPHRPIGLLELAGEARRRHDIAGSPDAGAAALAMRDRHRPAQRRRDRRGGVADMDHERGAADRGAVDTPSRTRKRGLSRPPSIDESVVPSGPGRGNSAIRRSVATTQLTSVGGINQVRLRIRARPRNSRQGTDKCQRSLLFL
jgi:hypothetical protein